MNANEPATAPTKGTVTPIIPLSEAVEELRALQRRRTILLKSRIMQNNRLQAVVAGSRGYHSGLPEKERLKGFAEAAKVVAAVVRGQGNDEPLRDVIAATLVGVQALDDLESGIVREMVRWAKKLPAAGWVSQPEQRGFGLQSLATVVGETGDLAHYANPAKVWRRMGCAPWSFDGQTRMGATWKSGREGKLPAMEWESYGYSPRRRSIAYLIGEGIVKQNFLAGDQGDGEGGDEKRVAESASASPRCPGPYRARYLQAKARVFETHPEWDWSPCDVCGGAGGSCGTCGGCGHKTKRAHLHGMLLATKLLLKNLWCVWNGKSGDEQRATDFVVA